MSNTTAESAAAPSVVILQECMNRETPKTDEQREIKLTATCDKYTKLEDATFACFNLDRSDYLLHFHLEGHERCVVKIKKMWWDGGAYFRPQLLKEGKVRLIPHFVKIVTRTGEPMKRRLTTSDVGDDVVARPQPPKKKILPATTPTTRDSTGVSEEGATSSDDDYPELTEISVIDKKSAKAHPGPKNHGSFQPTATAALPRDATASTWLVDFVEAKKKYVDEHPSLLNGRKVVNPKAHVEMIEGKYGTIAQRPCDSCVADGTPCRVYHPDCYEWELPGQNTVNSLGWRCADCRLYNGEGHRAGGCNAQHE